MKRTANKVQNAGEWFSEIFRSNTLTDKQNEKLKLLADNLESLTHTPQTTFWVMKTYSVLHVFTVKYAAVIHLKQTHTSL